MLTEEQRRERQRDSSRRWATSPRGKEKRRLSARKHNDTDKHRVIARNKMRDLRSTPEGREILLDRRYRYNYGITLKRRNEILVEQGNCCAICKTNTPKGRGGWHIDHCHTSNKVRGLLCHSCNLLLGHAKDNLTTLQSAIDYLKETYV